MSSATLPASATEARWLGLDLDNDPDGRIDNALGAILAALASVTGGVLQEAFDTGIASGDTIILVDIQTPSFADASGAGVRIRLGANADPAPCASETDTVCGGHLQVEFLDRRLGRLSRPEWVFDIPCADLAKCLAIVGYR